MSNEWIERAIEHIAKINFNMQSGDKDGILIGTDDDIIMSHVYSALSVIPEHISTDSISALEAFKNIRPSILGIVDGMAVPGRPVKAHQHAMYALNDLREMRRLERVGRTFTPMVGVPF